MKKEDSEVRVGNDIPTMEENAIAYFDRHGSTEYKWTAPSGEVEKHQSPEKKSKTEAGEHK